MFTPIAAQVEVPIATPIVSPQDISLLAQIEYVLPFDSISYFSDFFEELNREMSGYQVKSYGTIYASIFQRIYLYFYL